SAFKFQISPLAANLSVTLGPATILLSPNRSLVSVNDKLVSLQGPIYQQEGNWLVPIDFIVKVIKPISPTHFLWLESSRSIILGEVQPNQLNLGYLAEGAVSRIVFQSVRPIGFTVTAEGENVAIVPRSEDFNVGFQEMAFTDGILKKIAILQSGQKKAFQ